MSRLRLRPRRLEVEPLLVVPGMVCSSQPDGRRNNIDRTVAQNEPLGLRFGKKHKAAAIRPRFATGFAGGPYNGVTPKVGHGMLAWRKAASRGEVLRSPSPDGVSRSTALLKSPAELETQVLDQEERNTDEQQKRDANRPPLGALVVDVNVRDSKVEARLVGCPAEHASDHHTLDGPCRVR